MLSVLHNQPIRLTRFTGVHEIRTGKKTLVSDLDGTFLGQQRAQLQASLAQDHGDHVALFYATGRTPEEVASIDNLLEPAYTIACNGGVIYQGLPGTDKTPDAEWKARMDQTGFDKTLVRERANALGTSLNLKLEYDVFPSPYHYGIKVIADAPENSPEKLEQFLQSLYADFEVKGLRYIKYVARKGEKITMIAFGAEGADKNAAITFLQQRHGIPIQDMIYAGDDFNDISAMKDDGRGIIVVGNNPIVKAHVETLAVHRVDRRPPDEDSALGVLRGLQGHLARLKTLQNSPLLQFAARFQKQG